MIAAASKPSSQVTERNPAVGMRQIGTCLACLCHPRIGRCRLPGTTPLARPEAGALRVPGRVEETHLGSCGSPAWAGGTAVDAGRTNAVNERVRIATIAGKQGLPTKPVGWVGEVRWRLTELEA